MEVYIKKIINNKKWRKIRKNIEVGTTDRVTFQLFIGILRVIYLQLLFCVKMTCINYVSQF